MASEKNAKKYHHTEPVEVRNATKIAAEKAHEATRAIEFPDPEKVDEHADEQAVEALEHAVDTLERAVCDPSTPGRTTRKILHEEERALRAEEKAVARAKKGYTSMQDHASIDAEELAADAAELAEQAGMPKEKPEMMYIDWI